MKALESIKRGITSFKDVVPTMVVICIFNFISAFVMLSVIGLNPTPDRIAEVTVAMAAVFVVMMLVWVFLSGGIFSSVMSVVKTGNLNMGSFLGNCSKFFLRLLGLNVLGALITMVLWVIGAFLTGVFVALGGGNNIFFNIIGGIMLLITLIAVAIAAMPILISQYLAVVNDGGVKDSFGKAWAFVKGKFWATVGFFLLLAVCIFAVSFMVNIIASLLGNAIQGMGAAVISVILTSIVNGAIGVFSAVSIMNYLLGNLKTEDSTQATE